MGSNPEHSGQADLRVDIAETRAALAAMQQTMDSLRGEVRDMSRRLDGVTRLQAHHEQQSQGLDRAFQAIRELADSTRVGFDNMKSDHEDYRLRHEREESEWRERHVAENNKTRDRVVWFSGAAAMLSLVAASCVGLVLYYTDKAEVYQQRERDRLEQTVEDNTKRMHLLETYIPRLYPEEHR